MAAREKIAFREEPERAGVGDSALPKRSRAEAAAHILELRKGNRLPEGETIKDLIRYGRRGEY
jgi:hypothetical protein